MVRAFPEGSAWQTWTLADRSKPPSDRRAHAQVFGRARVCWMLSLVNSNVHFYNSASLSCGSERDHPDFPVFLRRSVELLELINAVSDWNPGWSVINHGHGSCLSWPQCVNVDLQTYALILAAVFNPELCLPRPASSNLPVPVVIVLQRLSELAASLSGGSLLVQLKASPR